MGLYDDIRCKYPLPVDGANDLAYQTKDTPAQWCDSYEIREDGTLWHREYDTEDRSDPNAEGLMRLAGCATRVNERWTQVPDFVGEVRFYTCNGNNGIEWIEWSAYFVDGKVAHMQLIENTPAEA